MADTHQQAGPQAPRLLASAPQGPGLGLEVVLLPLPPLGKMSKRDEGTPPSTDPLPGPGVCSCPYCARAIGESGGTVISISGARGSSLDTAERRSGLRAQKKKDGSTAQVQIACARGLAVQHQPGPTLPVKPASFLQQDCFIFLSNEQVQVSAANLWEIPFTLS